MQVCQFFTEIVQARSNERHGWRSWPDAMPFLFYRAFHGFAALQTPIDVLSPCVGLFYRGNWVVCASINGHFHTVFVQCGFGDGNRGLA